MDSTATWNNETRQAWELFVAEEQLSAQQADQFLRYMTLLTAWNQNINITRIIDPKEIITYHFRDSLALMRARSLEGCKGLCDVGSGGGFPGIPLAIMFPSLPIVLLEVNQKKCAFLQEVIKELGLTACVVESFDYRTFLRMGTYAVEYFVARASLRPDELVRALTAPAYTHAEVVYWASQHWQPSAPEKKYLKEEYRYTLEGQSRTLAFFKRY